MKENEKTIEDMSIEQKINEFADELEAIYLKEYSERIEAGEEADKTSVYKIQYYEKFVLRMKNSMEMAMKDIYIVDSENNGEHQIKIYKETKDDETGELKRNLMATVNEKGEVVFEPDFIGLQESVANKNLEQILVDNEENEKAELKQETYDLIEEQIPLSSMDKNQKKEELKKLEAESDSKEELRTKIELEITPGTVQRLTNAETREFADFKGHNVEFGYSKEQHGYIAYDKDTADVLMGPAITNTREITKQEPDGKITIERHYAMMKSNSNPDKMISIQIGQYGERIYNETDRTSEGDFVARTIDVKGKEQIGNNQLRKDMNIKETRENMGETADDLIALGVTTKRNTSWELSKADFEEFKKEMMQQMGPCGEEELIDRLKRAADEIHSEEITLGMIIEQAKADYIREEIEHNENIKNGEGRGLGEERQDAREERK